MDKNEHLLVCLSEECSEVSQRVAKALRFGILEIQPGQELNNAERIEFELCDMLAVIEMLQDAGIVDLYHERLLRAKEAKKQKVREFMEYAKQCGTLSAA